MVSDFSTQRSQVHAESFGSRKKLSESEMASNVYSVAKRIEQWFSDFILN
ncbi:hypothetical protein HanIR_Chr13g0639161 [Helianthus annuus]|nr:hypothetical protein HanIR_Chr13g0639161 [Helianthus annuus]